MKNVRVFSAVRDTIKRYAMIEPKDNVLIGVSGGPDSIFLVHAFLYLRKEYDIKLFAANLDHGIRGKESSDDSRFVRDFCRENNIPLIFKRVIFKKTKGLSIEETARVQRYRFFKAAAKKKSINKIATAHNLDDQAETVVMRFIKGTSLKGLSGIPPVRNDKEFSYIRPLIEMEKKALVDFLKKNGFKYRIDSTNNENKYLRNAVRNKILPYLQKYNPKIKRAMANLSDSLREDREFIEEVKNAQVKGMNHIKLKDIVLQPQALQREIVKEFMERRGLNTKKLSYRHWKEIKTLIRCMPKGKSLDLPGNIKIYKQNDRIWVDKV